MVAITTAWSRIQEGSATFQHNVLGLSRRSTGGTDTYFTRDESGTLVSTRTGSTKEYYLLDALGSVTGKTNGTNGQLTSRYDYDPYGGRDLATTGAASSADVAQGQFGYAGGYRSVGGLYHFGQRFYDPSTKRWTQTDPLDQAGDLRDGNKYVYASGDPIGFSDTDGRLSLGISATVCVGLCIKAGVKLGTKGASGSLGTGVGLGASTRVQASTSSPRAGIKGDISATGCGGYLSGTVSTRDVGLGPCTGASASLTGEVSAGVDYQ